jgi:single-stranded-DNA-specific exonuclease
LPAANLPAFARAFAAYAGANLRPEDMQSVLNVDAECALNELHVMSVEQVQRLAPFGQGNPRPVVAIRNGRILAPATRMGKSGNAVSFVICDAATTGSYAGRAAAGGSNGRIRCVGFQMGELADRLAGVNIIDLAGEPVLNHYNGRTSAEFHIKDVAWEQ